MKKMKMMILNYNKIEIMNDKTFFVIIIFIYYFLVFNRQLIIIYYYFLMKFIAQTQLINIKNIVFERLSYLNNLLKDKKLK